MAIEIGKYTIPSFLFSEKVTVVETGHREVGATDYVAALLYHPSSQAFVLHQEDSQPYLTFPGGGVEPDDDSLSAALHRELKEEGYATARDIPKEPILTIFHPATEVSPAQNIHIFLGVIDCVETIQPLLPVWVFESITEYMANDKLSKELNEIIQQYPFEKPCLIGAQLNTVVTYPIYPLANILVEAEYTD